ncbi:unnamed protein product [Ectocarpus sp. 13 AM-2016]
MTRSVALQPNRQLRLECWGPVFSCCRGEEEGVCLRLFSSTPGFARGPA